MRFGLALVTFAALTLLFGCFGIGGSPPEPEKNESKNISVIIVSQQNQTHESGGGIVENKSKEVEFGEDPQAPLGVYFIALDHNSNAILLKKGDFDMLIDGGEDGGKIVDFLHAHDVDDIEVLVSTNYDKRNYGGLKDVADNFEIESLWWSGQSRDSEYTALIQKIADKAKEVHVVEENFAKTMDGISFKVLNPPSTKFGDINNDAIVLRVDDRNLSLLLTSAIHAGAYGTLIARQPHEIKAEIMQAPYFGVGAGGTSEMGIFLTNTKPKYMIINGGAEESVASGGTRDPLRRMLEQYNIPSYETFNGGTVRITSSDSGVGIDRSG